MNFHWYFFAVLGKGPSQFKVGVINVWYNNKIGLFLSNIIIHSFGILYYLIFIYLYMYLSCNLKNKTALFLFELIRFILLFGNSNGIPSLQFGNFFIGNWGNICLYFQLGRVY